MSRVMIIDGTNAFYRSYIVDPSISANGQPVGGVIGFMKSLQKLIREIKPDQVVVCWDGAGGSQRRRSMNKNYKQGRKAVRLNRNDNNLSEDEQRENRTEQMFRLFEYINQLPIAQIVVDNVEADDIISAVCREFPGWQKIIVSSDKDFYQLLDDETILFRPIQKKIVNKKSLIEEFGIHPTNFALARAMAGDPSDNLPGITGAGLKTVAKRFPFMAEEKEYVVEELVEHCKSVENTLKFHNSVIENKELILDNYKIMQLYNPLLSVQAYEYVQNIISEYPKSFAKTEVRKMMLQDGFPQISWIDLFSACNRIVNDS